MENAQSREHERRWHRGAPPHDGPSRIGLGIRTVSVRSSSFCVSVYTRSDPVPQAPQGLSEVLKTLQSGLSPSEPGESGRRLRECGHMTTVSTATE